MNTRWKWWWPASLVAHLSLMLVASRAVPPRAQADSPSGPVAIDYVDPAVPESVEGATPGAGESSAVSQRELRLGGAHSPQNVSADNPGERGDGRSVESARMLAARADGVNLDPRLVNTIGATQEQRIRTSRERASPQDDRRTPSPADDAWVASGHGILLVRMHDAPEMPAEGAIERAQTASTAGDPAATRALPSAEVATVALGSTRPAGAQPRLAAGVRESDHGAARVAGPIASLRPAIERGHASTTADQAALRPDDDADAALLAASLMRAHVTASAQQGPERAEGSGGVGGGGSPGSGGGLGRGGMARAMGAGDGVLSLDTGDSRYVRYFGQVRRRIYQLTERSFPYEDALRLSQGTVIVTFVIERDGRVRDVSVQRASGVPRYDSNVRVALASANMPPIPAALGRERIAIRAPVEFSSPVVR